MKSSRSQSQDIFKRSYRYEGPISRHELYLQSLRENKPAPTIIVNSNQGVLYGAVSSAMGLHASFQYTNSGHTATDVIEHIDHQLCDMSGFGI